MNAKKTPVFCLDKESSVHLKQCLNSFSTRFFTDDKSLIKSVIATSKSEFLPAALVLTGDHQSVKEVLSSPRSGPIQSFIFCPNSNRLTYEPLAQVAGSRIVGFFATTEDLKIALDDVLNKSPAERQLIRFITDNLQAYLWYEFLKQTSFKLDAVPPKQSIDVAHINRQMERDPHLTLYTLRSSIRELSQRACSQKKIFYGTVVKKTVIDGLTANTNNLISFNSFVHLQGHTRTLDARHHALQCCSRRLDEVSVIFELEPADQPTFKITRVFHPANDESLWIVQLVGTHECVKVAKQFGHTTRSMPPFSRWPQPEIQFGQILQAMNESEKAYAYFFEILINRYDLLSQIYTTANNLWRQEDKQTEAIEVIATEFQKIKSAAPASTGREELTYFESEFDSIWETPIALQDEKKVLDLLPPVAYRLDQVLFKDTKPAPSVVTATTVPTRRHCTLL